MGAATHLRVLLGYLVCVMASGLLSAYPTMQQMMVDAGVFSSGCNGTPGHCQQQNQKLTALYYTGVGVSNGASLFIGLIYDIFGPKVAGVAGAAGVTASLLLAFVALSFQSAEGLLYAAVPLSDLFSSLNSFAIYGFCFMFGRKNVGFLLGIASSSYMAGSLMTTIAHALCQVMPLRFVFLVWAGFALVACALGALVYPSHQEFFRSAEKLSGVRPVPPRFRPLHLLRDLLDVMRQHPVDSGIYFSLSLCIYCAVQFFIGSFQPYTSFLFAEEEAEKLAVLSSWILAFGGVIGSPFSGWFFDRVGPSLYLVCCFCGCALVASLQFIASFGVQVMALLCTVILYSSWLTLIAKWAALYAPAELFGSYLSATLMWSGLLQLGLSFVTQAALAGAGVEGAFLYVWTLVPYSALAVWSSACPSIYHCSVAPLDDPPVCRTTGDPLWCCGRAEYRELIE